MIHRNYDAQVNRWFDCVAKGQHTFTGNQDRCVLCGALRSGPQVKIVRGPVPRAKKTR
jgi:hypothetical protein